MCYVGVFRKINILGNMFHFCVVGFCGFHYGLVLRLVFSSEKASVAAIPCK